MSKLMWLGWGLELVSMVGTLVPLALGRNWLGLTAVFWIMIMHTNRANLLAAQIEQINSRLGFGVSVPITEMPKVMEQIAGRIQVSPQTESPTEWTESQRGRIKRRNRGLLDELTALADETL